MLTLALALTSLNACLLAWLTLKHSARKQATGAMPLVAERPSFDGQGCVPPGHRFPPYGWLALGTLAALEVLLALRTAFVSTEFTACAWTAYIMLIDACVFRLRGRSLLHCPGRFAVLWLLSIPAWLVFEAYNLRLQNWAYVGVNWPLWRGLLSGCWAFATIYPGIFETAELLYFAGLNRLRTGGVCFSSAVRLAFIIFGTILLLLPLLLPRSTAAYLFGLVWAGFIFLLDPVNQWLGRPALLDGVAAGRPGWLVSLLASGYICGFFWEFWNYWAATRWQYIFPIFQRVKLFAMPLPGYIGFPPFALECFTMAVFISSLLLPPILRPEWPASRE
jgi:hypothetical protein